jgi:transposase
MVFIRKKRFGNRTYLYKVEGYRDEEGRVHQRVVEYLGREMTDRGGKARLIKKQSRDPKVEEILPFADLALLYDTAHQIDFVNVIDKLIPRERGTSVGQALLLLAINHLVGRMALEDVAEWYDRSMLQYWLDVPVEYFTEERLLSVLDNVCKQQTDLMRDKTWFISDAFRRKMEELWGVESRYLFYDRTQIMYFGDECFYAEPGYGPKEQKHQKKIGMAMVIRKGDGFPVLFRVYRGNWTDITTVQGIVNRLKNAGLQDVVLVLDRGMASEANMKDILAARYSMILGVPAKEQVFKDLVRELGDDQIDRLGNRIHRNNHVFCAVEKVKKKSGKPWRYVVFQDPKIRGEEKANLLQALGEAEERLESVKEEMAKERIGRGRKPKWEKHIRECLWGVGKYFSWGIHEGIVTWEIKKEIVDESLQRLARSVLVTNDFSIPKEEMVNVYLDKDEIEKVWRLGKGELGLKGIKHWKRDRVVSYLFVCYLSYILWAVIRRRLRKEKIELSVEKCLRVLQRVELVRLKYGDKTLVEPPTLVGLERMLFEKLDLEHWKDVVPM